MTTDRLNEIESRVNKATPGPWRKCTASEGRCRCGTIWSIPLDAPVAECNSKWGDGYEGTDSWMEYGDIGEEDKQNNKDFIAHARLDVVDLVNEIRGLRLQIEANHAKARNF